jgi:aminoglycoside/choline kinase family phosphotransferase
LLEWPDRAAAFLPKDRLDLTITLAPQLGPEVRNVRITGYGNIAARAEQLAAVRRFLDQSGFAEAERQRLAGDASTRSYERLTLGDRQVILMNAPRRPDGPPVKDGRPYSAIAHLAEDVKPFVAIANGLRDFGFSAPEIYAADLDDGLVILEDLGTHEIVDGEPPAPLDICYELGVDTLVELHGLDLPNALPVSPNVDYEIPRYDSAAFLIEVELLLDWYLPHVGAPLQGAARDAFSALWREALLPVLNEPTTWVLRDFHSPNLLFLPEREHVARLGLLDFQDAVLGPAAYDLASLLQDARVDISERMELELLGRYAHARRGNRHDFNTSDFAKIYSTVAAQRASKILGIFARLNRRDGKPQYLRHMPRVWGYLQRSLAHPALAALNAWYRTHVRPPR